MTKPKDLTLLVELRQQGLSLRAIAAQTSISYSTVKRALDGIGESHDAVVRVHQKPERAKHHTPVILPQEIRKRGQKKRSVERASFQSSENTQYKQESLKAALKLNFTLFDQIDLKYPHWLKPYCYIDLNAGRGQDNEGKDGSPLIFGKLAQEHGLNYSAHLYENDPESEQMLRQHLARLSYRRMFVHPESHNVLLNQIVAYGKNQYGIVYADPSNAQPAWSVMHAIKEHAPRMDMLISISCTSYKRQIKSPGYLHLDKRLLALKPVWFVREPISEFQWSILLGTGWGEYPEMKSHNFYSIESKHGRKIFENMVYTKKEQKDEKRSTPF